MPQTVTECRVSERRVCAVPTTCQPAASNELRWRATIQDISQTGLRLRLRRRFEPRSALTLELPGRPGAEASTVYVKVVHVRNVGDGYYTLGCEFLSELSEDTVDRLLVPEDAPAAAQGTVIANVRLWIGARGGRFVRCRAKRLHVASSWPMASGTALQLNGVAADGSRLEHVFEVVECASENDGWTLRLHAAAADDLPDWALRRLSNA